MITNKFWRMFSLVVGIVANFGNVAIGQDSEPSNSEPPQNFSEPEPAIDTSSQNPPENAIEPPAPDDGGGATEFSE